MDIFARVCALGVAVVVLGSFAAADSAQKPGPRVKHVVLFRYRKGTPPEKVKEIAEAFTSLRAKVPGIVGFESGTNMSPEGLSQGFDNVFVVTFKDKAARDAYLTHPEHRKFVQLLRPYLDKPLVVDYEDVSPRTTVEHPEGFLLKQGDRVVMVGDSITQAGGYVRMVKAVLDRYYAPLAIKVFNAGISGNKVTDVLARAERDIVRKKPTVITISIGINDVWHGFDDAHPQGDGPRRVPLPQYIGVYRKLLDLLLKKTSARIYLLTPTIIGEDTVNLGVKNRTLLPYCAAVRRLAAEYGLGLVELNDTFLFACHALWLRTGKLNDHGNLTKDGVHMLVPGDFLMAAKILQAWGARTEAILSITAEDAVR